MSLLTVWSDTDPMTHLIQTADAEVIARELGGVGVSYALLDTRDDVPLDGSQEDVLTAYRELVAQLVSEHGYTLIDVAQLHLSADSSQSQKETAAGARLKFLREHTHDEEEIRFFSHGSGVFYLHIGDRVLAMLCTAGDLLSVPALTTHWFDMGTKPDFTAIRFFHADDGWVGTFTGSDIATLFPTHDELAAAAARA